MQILIITNHVPYPPSSGTPSRNFNLLTRLAQEHEVWLAAFATTPEEKQGAEYLSKYCRGMITAEFQQTGAMGRPFRAIQYFFSGRPLDLRFYESRELFEKIREITSRINFDVVEIVDSYMGLYLEALNPEARPKVVLTFIDVLFSKYLRIARLEPTPKRKMRSLLNGKMMRRWEPRFAQRFHHCIAMSESDRNLLHSANPNLKIEIIPNGVDTKQFQPLPLPGSSQRLLFVGNMTYRPNIDAMIYFCNEVLPLIQREFPVELWIVGVNPSPELADLEKNGVHITGGVDDLRPYYEQSAVCVVPLRAGGGTRLKILEAMAFGRPVVSTSIGSEGLDIKHGEHLFIADTPSLFAEYTLRLLKDNKVWQDLTRQARALVVEHYDWDRIARKQMDLYEEVCRQ